MSYIPRDPHEPIKDDHASRVWQFILRSQRYPTIPLAFIPYVSQLHFITSPQGKTNRYLIRGIVQFTGTRTWYIMKKRYSLDATWIPLRLSETNKIAEYVSRPLPHNAHRTSMYNPGPLSLQRVGLDTPVSDLIRARTLYFDDQELDEILEYEARQAPINEDFPDPELTQYEIDEFNRLDSEYHGPPTNHHITDRFGQVTSGLYNGHYYSNYSFFQ